MMVDRPRKLYSMRRGNNNMLDETIPEPIISTMRETMVKMAATNPAWAQTSYAVNRQKVLVNKEERGMTRMYNSFPEMRPM